MSVLAGNWEQIDFLPVATKDEIKSAKSKLKRYRRIKLIADDFERRGVSDAKQKNFHENSKLLIDLMDRAVKLIIDEEIRQLTEMRFISGKPRYYVIAHYHTMDPSTIDRKIKKGIESVANSLKLWE